jgi:hypothetical protein
MPIIYLQHPQHGTKVAIAEEEAYADEKNGWERFDPAAPEIVPPPVENALRRRRKENADADVSR